MDFLDHEISTYWYYISVDFMTHENVKKDPPQLLLKKKPINSI